VAPEDVDRPVFADRCEHFVALVKIEPSCDGVHGRGRVRDEDEILRARADVGGELVFAASVRPR